MGRSTGRPIANAIVWQCRRTAAICEELKKQGLSEIVRRKPVWRSMLIFPN